MTKTASLALAGLREPCNSSQHSGCSAYTSVLLERQEGLSLGSCSLTPRPFGLQRESRKQMWRALLPSCVRRCISVASLTTGWPGSWLHGEAGCGEMTHLCLTSYTSDPLDANGEKEGMASGYQGAEKSSSYAVRWACIHVCRLPRAPLITFPLIFKSCAVATWSLHPGTFA